MKKYRRKPVIVEAVQWNGNNMPEIFFLMNKKAFYYGLNNSLLIETSEGLMTAHVNDWIIKGVGGEVYPIKNDMFEATYEEVKP